MTQSTDGLQRPTRFISRGLFRGAAVEQLWRDVAYGVRMLRRAPTFTATALLTLALGLGANTAIFTVVNAVLFRPLDYRDPSRLVALDGTVAGGTFLDWRARTRQFDRIGAAEYWTPALSRGGTPEQITALHISSDILPLLGVAPMLGRIPTAEEEHAGREQVVVLSYRAWARRFASDSGIVGRTISLNSAAYSVIGVMPPTFQFAPYWATKAEMWAPLVLDARTNDREGSSLRVFGRLRNGVTIQGAQADINSMNRAIDQASPGAAPDLHVVSLHEMVVGDVRTPLMILLGAVALVLVIACANVSHLQLLRAAARSRESAVRVALGASRGRMIQQSMVESVLLSLVGGVLAWGVAYAGVRVLVSLAPPSVPRLSAISMDGRVFAFLLLVSLAASIVFGVGPALRASSVKSGDALKGGSRGASETRGRKRARGALVASEFAMALVLLVGATLLIRSFVALQHVDNGFDARNGLTMSVSLDGTSHHDPALRAQFYATLLSRIAEMPGVSAVGAINHLPIAGDNWNFHFAIEGRALPDPKQAPKALFRVTEPGYFGAMRIPLRAGRDFSEQDKASAAHVMIINTTMARHLWPNDDPIGKRISVDDPVKGADWFTIVGVASDATQAHLTDEREGEMYFPYMIDPRATSGGHALISLLFPSEMMLFIRANGDPSALTKPIEAIVSAMDHDAAVSQVATMQDVVATQFTAPTFYLSLLGSFAAIAVLLAAVGVYGVISYAAAVRTREMGVRMALGADASEPFRLVVAEGMRLAAIGGVAGIIGALVLTRQLRALLFAVQPNDPAMFVVATVALAVVALVACYIPARRASRIDPVIALRSE